MLHQAEKEGQVLNRHPFLIQGEDMRAGFGMNKIIRILNTFGYSFER